MQPVISFGVIHLSDSTCRHYFLQIALILNCRLHKEIVKCQGHLCIFIFSENLSEQVVGSFAVKLE